MLSFRGWRYSLQLLVIARVYPGVPILPTMSTTINILHGFSLCIALLVLVMSIYDCGILSVSVYHMWPNIWTIISIEQLCLNPLLALFTIGYHSAMLSLAYNRPEDAPILPVGYLIAPYLLSLAWLGAYIAMSMLLANRTRTIDVFQLQILVPQTLRATQKMQVMFDPLESTILACIAIRSTIERRQMQRFQTKVPIV